MCSPIFSYMCTKVTVFHLCRKYGNTEYADDLIRRAKELYMFAYNHRAKYSDSIPEVYFYTCHLGRESVDLQDV